MEEINGGNNNLDLASDKKVVIEPSEELKTDIEAEQKARQEAKRAEETEEAKPQESTEPIETKVTEQPSDSQQVNHTIASNPVISNAAVKDTYKSASPRQNADLTHKQSILYEKSLVGVDGVLGLFVVAFIVSSLVIIEWLFLSSTQRDLILNIFFSLLFAGTICSAILIIRRKKIGAVFSKITIAISLFCSLYAIGLSYFASSLYTSNFPSHFHSAIVGGLISLIIHGFCIFYFTVSERVKQTLVK
jgi:hypothetical protein